MNPSDSWKLGIIARARSSSMRSEEHTSELQSLTNLVCRLLLEKKKTPMNRPSGDPDIVVFDAIAVPADLRNSMVTWTPGIGLNPLVQRMYHVTLSGVRGCKES